MSAPQIATADPSASVFVTANAGSGKTATLVSRVARLLRRGVDPASILCVTYTKAAAAEMQHRLFATLGEWSVLSDEKLAGRLAELEGALDAGFDQAALSQARALFARALETPGGLKIETIHAFCEKLLRRFPLEAGVSPRFQVMEDAAAHALSQGARDQLAIAATEADPESLLFRAFAHFAVDLDYGRFENLFRTIETRRADLQRYVDRLSEGSAPSPWALCGLPEGTLPETLEAEGVNDVDWSQWRAAAQALDAGSSTDRKIAAVMAAINPSTATFEDVCKVFCTGGGEARASMATKQTAKDYPDAAAWLAREQARVVGAQGRIRAARIARDTVYVLTLAASYGAIYEASKAAQGALDFADLIDKTRDLLATREDAAWVLYKLDSGLDHVLLDEAQDTSPEQWEILSHLTAEFFAGAGARASVAFDRTVFAVGDEKQSIYSFQGAQPERFMRERDAYEKRAEPAGAKLVTVSLPESWRSVPAVLRFVDEVCKAPDAAVALDPYYGAPNEHVAKRLGQPGSVDLWAPPFKDPDRPERDAFDPVDAEAGDSGNRQLAAAIARSIQGSVTRGEAVHDKSLNDRKGGWRAADYGDFLILVRRRNALFEEIIRALKGAGVPVAGADRLKLSEHIAFDDLRALARFALFPGDDLTLAALLRSPFCGVDEQSLYDLAQGRERGLYTTLRNRAGERPEWLEASELMASVIAEARTRRPFEFYNRFLGRLDADGRSMRSRLLTRLGREAEDAIDEFLNQTLAAEARGVHDLEGLSAELDSSDVEVKRELKAARGEVRVMTVHGAKGLEAPVVFLPDTTSDITRRQRSLASPLLEMEGGGFLWAPRAKDDCDASDAARGQRDLRSDQESLRLLYVALTRARDRVVICGRASSKGVADPTSWWTRLAAAFDALDTREVVEDGRTIVRFGDDPQFMAHAAKDKDAAAALPAWAQVKLKSERGARWASPSNISDQAKAPAPSPLAERSGLGRFRRGELIHKLFEVLPDVAPERRRAAAERMLAREPDLTPDQRAEMADAAFGVLEDPQFAEVFGEGSRAEAALAGTAPGLPQGVAISGRLDRLVVGPEKVLVVDYKTNRPAPVAIADADPAYIAQMAVYVAVLRALYPEKAVEAALVWTDGPKLMPVPQKVIEQALESLRRDS